MCGCKGCQEITTLDLANNTETITELPTSECGPIDSTVKILTCECGITLDIYNGAGILIESNQSGGYNSGEGGIFFEFTNSTVWESQLGSDYVLTIKYNSAEGRWELTYYNEELGDTILIGYYVTQNTCPTSIQGWELNCISFGVFVLVFPPPTFINLVTWTGTYVNNKKSYSFSSDWSGSTFDYTIEWDIAPPAAGAPVGTQCWILYEDQGAGFLPIEYIFADTTCPFGQWQSYWGSPTSRFFTKDLGVTNYNIKISPIDCQCCNEKLTISISLPTKPPTEINVEANIQVDSEGNHLIYNGYPYYVFYIETDIYYIFFNSVTNTWVVSTILTEDIMYITENTSTGLCPFGYYLVSEKIFPRFWVRGYDCGDQVEKDFCEKVHEKQCEFATKTLKYLKHLQFGNTCCEELDALKNDKRILEILNCYDTRDIPSNTTDYNTIPYIQIKRLLGC